MALICCFPASIRSHCPDCPLGPERRIPLSDSNSPDSVSSNNSARNLPANLSGKRVLITGGTGTTGKILTRWLLDETDAEEIIIYSRDEQKHHELQLDPANDPARVRSIIGDIRDLDQLRFAMKGVSLVFHTAAMKHVHLAEQHPVEAHKTNVLGTRHVIETALSEKVSRVIASSTDKAVDPINVYGNTKFMMELELMKADREKAGNTRFDVIRHGNLLGSKGSVVPLFIEQAKKGCLTLTYPAMTRFWIGRDSLLDSFHHCLHQSEGGETIIPRSPSCRIDVLACAIDEAVDQEVTGIRPGEKQHELLTSLQECPLMTDCGDHLIVRSPSASASMRGEAVAEDFQLRSDLAPQLTIQEMRELLIAEGWLP